LGGLSKFFKFILASTAKVEWIAVPMRASSGNKSASFDAPKPQTAQSWHKTDLSEV
jgi:hypothetical protein